MSEMITYKKIPCKDCELYDPQTDECTNQASVCPTDILIEIRHSILPPFQKTHPEAFAECACGATFKNYEQIGKHFEGGTPE